MTLLNPSKNCQISQFFFFNMLHSLTDFVTSLLKNLLVAQIHRAAFVSSVRQSWKARMIVCFPFTLLLLCKVYRVCTCIHYWSLSFKRSCYKVRVPLAIVAFIIIWWPFPPEGIKCFFFNDFHISNNIVCLWPILKKFLWVWEFTECLQ